MPSNTFIGHPYIVHWLYSSGDSHPTLKYNSALINSNVLGKFCSLGAEAEHFVVLLEDKTSVGTKYLLMNMVYNVIVLSVKSNACNDAVSTD